MTIDEAIKLQSELQSLLSEVGFNKYIASTKLGIEALKFYKAIKTPPHISPHFPLPGETEG